MRNFTDNNIKFTETFCVDGANVVLFPKKENTKKEIEIAKQQLKLERDCCSFRIANANDIANEFNSEIFKHPKVKSLKWYQVDNDSKGILKAIKNGVSVFDYVHEHILPRVKITEEQNLKLYGKNIYSF